MPGRYIVFLLLVLTLANCQSDTLTSQKEGENYPLEISQDIDPLLEQRMIRSANYRFQVPNVEQSTEYIKNVVAAHQGFITQMDQSNSNYLINNHLIIKAPAAQFENLLNTLGEESVFTDYKRIKSQDVGAEFIDIKARLQTKKEVQARYIEILREQAGNVKDILEAEEKIRLLQEEIEAKEARLHYLQEQVQYSTIHLEIYQKVEYRAKPVVFKESFLGRLKTSFLNGWEAILNIVLFLINIWPFLLLGGLFFWQRKRLYRFFSG